MDNELYSHVLFCEALEALNPEEIQQPQAMVILALCSTRKRICLYLGMMAL